MILNCDLKQIEVVVLSWLSKDPTYQKLILDGVDIYKYFASIMYNKPEADITKDERDSLKIPILGISYGKGAPKLAIETGKSEEWCVEFIDNFYGQFPKVRVLHDRWIEEVRKTGQIRMFDGINLQFKKYCWNNETNKKELYDPSNPKHKRPKYWETDIKNYPVQHTAFTIMSLFLSTFLREKALHNRDKYLMICTVHDSLMLDVRNEYVDIAKSDITDVLDKLPNLIYNNYREKFDLSVRADVTIGESWYELG